MIRQNGTGHLRAGSAMAVPLNGGASASLVLVLSAFLLSPFAFPSLLGL
jgi:hypothetical protein